MDCGRFQRLSGSYYHGVCNGYWLVFDSESLAIAYARADSAPSDGRSDQLGEAARQFRVLIASSTPPAERRHQESLLLRLLVTSRCNLECSYCQMRRGIGPQRWQGDLPDDRARAVVANLINAGHDHVTIHFSGGEPLIVPQSVMSVSQVARDLLGDRVRLAMSTNGTLITDEIATLVKRYDIQTVVSLDGPGAFNTHRRSRTGSESAARALAGYRTLKEAGLNPGLSLVATSHNLPAVPQIVTQLLSELEPASIGINYLHYPGFDSSAAGDDSSLRSYAHALFEAYRICRQAEVFEEQSNRVIEPFVRQRPRTSHCSSHTSQVTVSPDGVAGPCKTFLTRGYDCEPYPGWLQADDISLLPSFQKWRARHVSDIAACSDCMVRNLCGGGCAYEAFVDTESIMNANSRYCVVPQFVFGRLVEELVSIGAFRGASRALKLLPMRERSRLLSSPSAETLHLTTSIGHMLE